MKVLTIGHSLAVDSNYMLSLIAAAEGYTGLTTGTLYYPGCSLSRHVQFMSKDARDYCLYVGKSDDVSKVRDKIERITTKEAIRLLDWDVIVLQGDPFEPATEATFSDGNIQILQKVVNDNKLNPNAIFAWHLFWPIATDPDLMATYPKKPYPYGVKYEELFDTDRNKLYTAYTECVRKYILTDETFRFVIPSGTVPMAYFNTTDSPVDWVLSEHEKALILEAVNNALKNPLQVTASQYTQAPTQ